MGVLGLVLRAVAFEDCIARLLLTAICFAALVRSVVPTFSEVSSAIAQQVEVTLLQRTVNIDRPTGSK